MAAAPWVPGGSRWGLPPRALVTCGGKAPRQPTIQARKNRLDRLEAGDWRECLGLSARAAAGRLYSLCCREKGKVRALRGVGGTQCTRDPAHFRGHAVAARCRLLRSVAHLEE